MDNIFRYLEQLEYVSLQLKSYCHTLDTIQAQFEIQKVEEEVISSYVTLKHSINGKRRIRTRVFNNVNL